MDVCVEIRNRKTKNFQVLYSGFSVKECAKWIADNNPEMGDQDELIIAKRLI